MLSPRRALWMGNKTRTMDDTPLSSQSVFAPCEGGISPSPKGHIAQARSIYYHLYGVLRLTSAGQERLCPCRLLFIDGKTAKILAPLSLSDIGPFTISFDSGHSQWPVLLLQELGGEKILRFCTPLTEPQLTKLLGLPELRIAP
jgi:hypothetical protein